MTRPGADPSMVVAVVFLLALVGALVVLNRPVSDRATPPPTPMPSPTK
jgi:hypothetical protein